MYGDVIRRARAARRFTQGDLATISGLTQSNISAIENDRRRPGADTLHRLLAACGFELVAMAGSLVIPLPPPLDDGDPDVLADLLSVRPRTDDPGDGEPNVDPPAAGEQRSRMLRAALDASEAIIRSR